MKKQMTVLAGALFLLFFFCVPASAEAANISNKSIVKETDQRVLSERLFNRDAVTEIKIPDGTWFRLQHPDGIGSLFLIFDVEYPSFTVTNDITGQSVRIETNDIIHIFVDLQECFGSATTSVTLTLDSGVCLMTEIYCFGPGEAPGWVERWEPPVEKADLLLLSTHGDDEQLFFAGVLPYYAGEKEMQVEVAYLTSHRNFGTLRRHEMLNGLWAVGVKNYPIFGPFPDIQSKELWLAYNAYYRKDITDEQLIGYVVEQIRRFRPEVVVGHDINGEYGHGMHMLYTDILMKALEITADPDEYPELAEQYGVWDVPKTYLHLYEENPIVMDWDQPLEHFGGMTAFEVTQKLGFPCHESQQKYYKWYLSFAHSAAEIPQYNPCYYGLYRTKVGNDVKLDDFFENIDAEALNHDAPPEEEPQPVPPTTVLEPQLQQAKPRRVQPGTVTPEKTWLILPAFGTVILTALTAWQVRKKK